MDNETVAGSGAEDTTAEKVSDEFAEMKEEIVFEYESGHLNQAIKLYREMYPDDHESDAFIERCIGHMRTMQIHQEQDDRVKQLQSELSALRDQNARLQSELIEMAYNAENNPNYDVVKALDGLVDDLRQAAKGEG